MSNYFAKYGNSVDTIFDTRYVNILKDKKVYIDPPNIDGTLKKKKYVQLKHVCKHELEYQDEGVGGSN